MVVLPATTAAPLLPTARLRLVAADEKLAAALADFHVRNQAHLAPWDPPAPADALTEAPLVLVASATNGPGPTIVGAVDESQKTVAAAAIDPAVTVRLSDPKKPLVSV